MRAKNIYTQNKASFKALFLLLLSVLVFPFEGKSAMKAPSQNEILGPYVLTFSLGNSGDLNDFEATLSQDESGLHLNFQVAVAIANASVHAKVTYSDGSLVLRSSDMTITDSSTPGLSLSLGHKDSSGNVTAAESITGTWNGEGFSFVPEDCIVLRHTFANIVASNITMTRVEEEIPVCKYSGSIPGNGAVVPMLDQIITFWHTITDDVVVNYVSIPLIDQNGQQVSTGRLTNTSDTTNLIKFDPRIVEPGNYTIVIPEGTVTTKNDVPLNSETKLNFTIVDKNFIPTIDAIIDDYSLSFVVEPNGTLSSIATSIESSDEPEKVIVNFPIQLLGQQCNLAVPSDYHDGRLTIQHNEADLIPSPLGNLAIGFYRWMEGHAWFEAVDEIYADWNGNGFTFDPDDIIIVKGEDGNQYLFADFIVLTKNSETEFKCQPVVFDYDGRYLKLGSTGLYDAIYYSLEESIAPINGKMYDGEFDVNGLNPVWAVAVKNGYTPSDDCEFEPLVYGIDGEAWVAEGGTLQKAFLWLSRDQQLEGWPYMKIHGFVDAQSYGYLGYLNQLRHLDLSDAVSPIIPDDALKSTGLVSIRLPKGIQSIGKKVFENSMNLTSLEWNTESDVTTEEGAVLNEMLGGRNVLFYINGYNCPSNMAGINIIKDGRAQKAVVLTDANPWFALKDFTAPEISFVKNFSKKTPIDGCGGWETVSLPFDVQNITFGSESLYPFGNSNGDEMSKRFWLYRTNGDWDASSLIQKNVPYLIAMPNNEAYYQPYNIVGDVKFSSTEASIEATEDYEGDLFRDGLRFYPNYKNIKNEGVQLTVNDDVVEGNMPGSLFVVGDVKPFEGYMAGASVQQIRIMDSSSSVNTLGVYGVRIWNEGSHISIISPIDCKLPIYDTLGRIVEVANVAKDVPFISSTLNKGIYIVGGRKILVKY